MLDLAEYYNKAIMKSAKNPFTSSLPASLLPAFLLPTSLPLTSSPPASLPPIFKPLVSATFKKFNLCCASTSLKRQADRIAV